MEPEGSLPQSQEPAGPRLCIVFRNMVSFYGEELLAPHPTPKLEDHPLSAVRDCIFAATLHIRRPFLHPLPENAPCRGDRDPRIMGLASNILNKSWITEKGWFCSLEVGRGANNSPLISPLFCKMGNPQNINFAAEARRWLRFTYHKCFER
jgi:hypothetical protein